MVINLYLLVFESSAIVGLRIATIHDGIFKGEEAVWYADFGSYAAALTELTPVLHLLPKCKIIIHT